MAKDGRYPEIAGAIFQGMAKLFSALKLQERYFRARFGLTIF